MIRHETRRVAISDLETDARNPRTISDQALTRLTASLQRFGVVQPIVVNRRTATVVGGHQRLEALRQLGESEVDVVEVDLDDDGQRALNLALNSPYLQGEFTADVAALVDGIRPLDDMIASLGLDELRLDLATPTVVVETDPDRLVARGAGRMRRNEATHDVVAIGPWLGRVTRDLSQQIADALQERWPEDTEAAAEWVCRIVAEALSP